MWLTFQPGEIRVCASCHGVNALDQAGHVAPVNTPLALTELLEFWKGLPNDSPSYDLNGTQTGRTKRNVTLNIVGKNAAAASKNLKLTLSINNKSCPADILEFTTASNGMYQISKKLPVLAMGKKLKFSLTYLGRAVASKTFAKSSGIQSRKAKLTRLCQKITEKFN